MISIVHVSNAFEPTKNRITFELPFVAGQPLQEYLRQVLETSDALVISVNGGIVSADVWADVLLVDGDYIVASPHIANGNLLRTVASLAVLATAAIVTSGASLTLAGFTLGFMGLGATAGASALISGAIVIGGNLLVGALFGGSPSQKSNSASYDPDGPRSLARSGTVIPKGYGTMHWGGNIIASFTDIEGEDQYLNCLVCYGFGPARSITQIQINGKDVSTYKNVQIYTRLGSNDQLPMPNFNRVVNGYPQNVQCLAGQPVVVPGTGTQTQILQVDVVFPSGIFVLTSKGNLIPAVVTYKVEYSLSGSGIWQSALRPLTTSDVVSYNPDGTPKNPHAWCVVATDMPPHSGICHALDDGPHNPGDPWVGSKTVTTYQPNGNHSTYQRSFRGEWQRTNPLLNQVLVLTWTDGYVDFAAADRAPLYNRTSIYGLAAGKYDVRVTKYGSARLHDNVVYGDNNDANIGQQIWIHSVNEISLLDLAYPNMILIGVRALATNQISGSNVNITATITHGLRSVDRNILPSALRAYEEDNPACIAADAMLDDFYGGGEFPGIVAANINRYINEWIDWADLNDELVPDGNGGSIRRHVFNGVFDSEGSLWDALNTVSRMSRAALMPLGRDYGVFVDQPDVPVQMFTMGNIVADSFQENWLQIDDRANQVEIQIADSTRYWRTDNPLVYMDPANQDAGAVIKNVRIDGKGITLPAQAWHAARFRERNNQFLLRSGSFKCDVDAIACRPGNLVILQHDIPQWGFGGRTLPGSTAAAILVDRNDLAFVAGTSYSLVVLHPALLRFTGALTAQIALIDATGARTGTQISVSGFDGVNRVTRCVITSASGQVWDAPVSSYSAGQVVIQPTAGFAGVVGNSVKLYDTDVLETRAVTGISAGGANSAGAVLLGTALSQPPQDYSVYFYGPVGSQKTVRITNIKKSSEFRATIEWIDYDARVYLDATPVVGETSALSSSRPGVTSLTGAESFETVSGSYVGYASLSWKLGPDTVGVGIYGFIVGGATTTGTALPKLLARLTHYPTSWKMQLDPGQTYTFIIVGFDAKDDYANIQTAPTVTIAAVGIANNLLLGSSFENGFAYWNLTPRAGDLLVPSLPPANVVFTPGATTTTTTPDAVTTLSNQETRTDWTSPSNGGAPTTSRTGTSSASNPTIKSLLYAGCTARIIGHLEVWFNGDGQHTVDTTRAPGYNQLNASEVATHCSRIKSLGFDVVMPNTYALGTNPNKALELYLPALQTAGLGCIINIDKGVYSAASSPIAAIRTYLLYLRNGQNGALGAFQRPNYEKYNGKFIVTYFAVPTDDPAMFRQIESENTDILFVYNNKSQALASSQNVFAWVQPDLAANLDGWCYEFSGVPSTQLCIPVVSPGFNDTLVRNGKPTSVWDASVAARVWPPGSPGPGPNATTLASYFTILNKWYSTAKQPPYIQVATLNDWDEYTAVEPTPNGAPGFFGSVTNATAGGAFVFNPAAAVGNDAVLQASGTYPYNNGVFVRTLSTTADSCTQFSVSFQIMFPTAADETACQALEFTLQQNVNGHLFAFSWQADIKGSGFWRTRDPNAGTWNPTTIAVDTSLFAAGVYTTVTAQFRRESDNSLTHTSLAINGTVHPVNRNTAGASLVESSYVNLSFALDSNGGNPPTAYSVHLRNITATLTTPGSSSTTTTPGTASASTLPTSGQNLATYSVGAAAMTGAFSLINQLVPATKWSAGQTLILSAYVKDFCVSSAAPNVGSLIARLICFDAAGTPIAAGEAVSVMNGVIPALVRVNTPPVVIPAGTVSVTVDLLVQNGPINVPPGSVLTTSHWLLEIASPGQTQPSAWAEIDVHGNVLGLFLLGSSSGLRGQGSAVPSFTGRLGFTASDVTLAPTWTGLAILWPDGAYTFVQDGQTTVASLTAATTYYAYPYFDILSGGVRFAVPSIPLGAPGILSAAYDAMADAACHQDGRVPLGPGGLKVTTNASGGGTTTTPPAGGGTGAPPSGGGTGTLPPNPTPNPRRYLLP